VVRVRAVLLILLAAAAGTACGRGRTYQLQGQVLAVHPDQPAITIKHGDIRGFMPAMTMTFKVKDAALIRDRQPGDLVAATLVLRDNEAYLSTIRSTGRAPLTEAPPPPVPSILPTGELVPDAVLTDHEGRTRRISEWRGQAIGVTFIYTRCPLPDFCPAMDRNFAQAQRQIAADPRLRGRAHLLSISFDPQYDTPAVLAQHAKRIGADPAYWTLLTGDREAVAAFGSSFGLTILPGATPEIVHNLRTAVIDRDGRLAAILTGNAWTPGELLQHLRNGLR
jgi:protein SCO1